VIGGLCTSTLLTLVVIPVVYTLMDDMVTRFHGRDRRPRRETPEAYPTREIPLTDVPRETLRRMEGG
jgi:hypothetical protein